MEKISQCGFHNVSRFAAALLLGLTAVAFGCSARTPAAPGVTPDIEATVQARVTATVAAQPTPTPSHMAAPTEPTATPVPVNAQVLPQCTPHQFDLPHIDLGIRLSGCHTERVNIYFSNSVPYSTIAAVDRLLESIDSALLTQLNIDVTTRDLPDIYLVSDMGELDLIKIYFDAPTGGSSGWYSCCGDRPAIYGELNAHTWPMQVVAHGYVHYALDNNVHLPGWIDEGLASYYEIELLPFDPTGEVFWTARNAQSVAKQGRLTPLTDLEAHWSRGRGVGLLQYAQSYMAIRYIIELHGYPAVEKILELLYQGSDVSTALRRAVGKSYAEFETDFANWLLAWGENDPRYQSYVDGSGSSLDCYSPCVRREDWAGVSFADLSAEATFTNPTQTSLFEYGFNIRDRIRIGVTSDRSWNTYAWSADWSTGAYIGEGRVDVPFDTSLGGENHLRVTAVGDRGCIFVNGEPVSCFDLPAHAATGDIAVFSTNGSVWYRGFSTTPEPTTSPVPKGDTDPPRPIKLSDVEWNPFRLKRDYSDRLVAMNVRVIGISHNILYVSTPKIPNIHCELPDKLSDDDVALLAMLEEGRTVTVVGVVEFHEYGHPRLTNCLPSMPETTPWPTPAPPSRPTPGSVTTLAEDDWDNPFG